MKQTILSLLSRLFRSMKADGAKYHSSVIPLIRTTVIPGAPLGEALLEDTLELWATIIQQTPKPSSESELNADLMGLVEFLLLLLEHDTENLEKAIEILEAYILLAPNFVLSRQVYPQVMNSFKSKLGTMHSGHSGYVTNAIEHAWQAAIALQGKAAAEELVFQMLSTGFFDELINGLKEAWEAHQTTGPKAIHTKIQGIIETDYFAIISRIAYESPELFMQAFEKSKSAQQSPAKMKTNEEDFAALPIKWLLDEWFSHAEDFGDPDRRKLMTMALTKLLDLPQPLLLSQMQSLFSLWTNVITELVEESDPTVDSLVWPAQLPDDGLLKSPDEERRSQLAKDDPVHTTNLIILVRNCLGNFIQRCGGEERFQEEVLVNVDKDVINSFGALGVLR
jgi:importin-11